MIEDRELKIVPAQCIAQPKGNGDQNALHNYCKSSNENSGEDETPYMYRSILF